MLVVAVVCAWLADWLLGGMWFCGSVPNSWWHHSYPHAGPPITYKHGFRQLYSTNCEDISIPIICSLDGSVDLFATNPEKFRVKMLYNWLVAQNAYSPRVSGHIQRISFQ